MSAQSHVEYVGFTTGPSVRLYTLRVRRTTGETEDFTVGIPNEAFLRGRVRYQDGAEVCFQRLQRELQLFGEQMPERHLVITDSDLTSYKEAHAPRPPNRRPRPPVVS